MSEFKRSDDLFDRTSYSGYSGNADELMQWKEIAKRGTSGDQVWNILMAWQKERDALQAELKETDDSNWKLREKLNIAVEALNVIYISASPDDYGWKLCLDALAKINELEKGESK